MPLILQWIVIGFCSLFLLLGLAIGNEALGFVGKGEATTGEVISIRVETETRTGDDGFEQTYTSDWPTVRYVTATGDTYEAEVEVSIGYGDQAVGQEVRIRYMTEAPHRVILARGFWDLWLAPLAFTLMGGLFTGGAFFLFRQSNRAEREAYHKKYGIRP